MIPLPLLLVLVVGGIAAVVVLVQLLGGGAPAIFRTEAAARDALLADYPELDIRAMHVATDGRTAVADTDRGAAIVAAMGHGRLTRLLEPGDVDAAEMSDRGLILRLSDYTAPKVAIACDGAKRAEIETLLNGAKA